MDTNKKVGPIVGVLVIVLVIIIASLYFFGRKLNTENTNTTPSTEAVVETTSTEESTDSAAVIEADIDSQLKDIDTSF
jgi:Na+-transporting methylmalonyl-CoA/oxaloacetate decarboxylase gamma subunit